MSLKDTELRSNMKKNKSLELEQGVIGSILLEPAYLKYLEFLTIDDFTTDYHKKIWKRIKDVETFDPLTIGAGESKDFQHYVISLYDAIPSAENAQTYARLLRENTRERELKKKLISVAKDMESELIDTDTAISELNIAFENVNSMMLSSIVSQEEVVKEMYNDLFDKSVKKSYQTGLQMFDINLKLRKGEMFTLGAGSGIGKSSFAINLAMRISKANNKAKILIYSLEMDKKDVYRKMLSHISKISDRKLSNENKKFSDGEKVVIKQATDKLMEDYNIMVHDDYGIDIAVLKNQVSELVIKGELDFLIIDQISLVSVKDRKFQQERHRMRYISWEIRKLAGELNIPIIILAQLNRQSENEPANISHIAESYDIVRDSSIVMLLDTNRNDYTNPKQYTLNAVKVRHGRPCQVPLIVDQSILSFEEGELGNDGNDDVPF